MITRNRVNSHSHNLKMDFFTIWVITQNSRHDFGCLYYFNRLCIEKHQYFFHFEPFQRSAAFNLVSDKYHHKRPHKIRAALINVIPVRCILFPWSSPKVIRTCGRGKRLCHLVLA
nr:MAG TPA_asm: hypothetical protein [Caudoviricetes sp.]